MGGGGGLSAPPLTCLQSMLGVLSFMNYRKIEVLLLREYIIEKSVVKKLLKKWFLNVQNNRLHFPSPKTKSKYLSENMTYKKFY